jgi:DNA-binding NtrC family response regulator
VDPIPVVALVPAGRVITMRRAQAAGAADVLFCPPEVDEIRAEIEEVSARARGGDVIDRDLFQEIVQESLVGEGSRFRKCLEELKRAARCDANVLLVGETGTGKEMLAKAIHRLSRRATGPYLPVNCASLPGTLLESELFGHARGAFTGAQSARLGRFETVGAGTLLLDEVGDIEPALQIKLLRVIEQREFQRLGENTAVKFNGRLICAASVGLDEAVAAGRFRKDLLGRIDQFRISMPALRERRLDIPILLRHFLRKHGQARKVGISRPAMDLLESYDYPMNVRQLENAVVSALARSDPGTLILPQHLPAEIKATAPSEGKQDCHAILVPRSSKYEDARSLVIREVDRIYLGALLDKHHGNRSRAAAEAGVDRGTFTERAKQALGEKDEGPHA